MSERAEADQGYYEGRNDVPINLEADDGHTFAYWQARIAGEKERAYTDGYKRATPNGDSDYYHREYLRGYKNRAAVETSVADALIERLEEAS